MSAPVIAVCAVWLAACGLLVLVLHRASRARQPAKVQAHDFDRQGRPALPEPELMLATLDERSRVIANVALANNWNRLMRELQQ